MGGGPSERLLCILPFPEPTAIIEQLRANHPSVEFTYHELRFGGNQWDKMREVPKDIFKDKTILVTLSALPPSPSDCPALEVIQFFSAGINHIVEHPIYKDTTITLTTSSGIHGPQIAEWVLMTTLVQSHKYNQLYELQKQHNWVGNDTDGDYHKVRDLVGQRLGVLGYGSIGRQVARVCKAAGMDVIAFTASPRKTPESRRDPGFIVPGTGDPGGSIPSAWYSGLDRQSLRHFLKQGIDILLVSVPLTPDTLHFIAKEEFDVMAAHGKPLLVNISRGKILNQDDLIEALRQDQIRGACLDVADPEPLPKDNPLWGMKNVTLTPHVSGVGVNYSERCFQLLDENLTRKAKGQKLINVVDRKKGY